MAMKHQPPLETATTPLPARIDELAAAEPDAVYAEFPKSAISYEDGFRPITFRQLACAINAVAYWIDEHVGPARRSETLAYIGPNDVRYVFMFVAAIKTGYKLFLTSPRNSVAAHVHLLSELKCSRMVIAEPTPSNFEQVCQHISLQIQHIPSIDELLSYDGPAHTFEYSYSQAANQDAFAAHTSGSTGLPKPYVYNHAFIAKAVRNILLRPPEGHYSLHEMFSNNRSIVLLPFFHPAGVLFGILLAIYNRTTIILPSSSAPPNVDGLRAILNQTRADWLITAPSILEALAKDRKALEDIAGKLQFVAFGGGSLSRPLGEIVASKIRVVNSLGSSETAGYPTIFPDGFDFKHDWPCIQMHPAAEIVMEPMGSNCFEMVIKRTQTAEPYQPVFELFPNKNEHRTADLFTPHPQNPKLWMHASRSDDIIVLANGEKTNPTSFEMEICKHPNVVSALVFGAQRFELGVLVEPKEDKDLSSQGREEFITTIWPVIEEANKSAPAHARISKSHVLLTRQDLPVQRTSKDTVKRKETLKLYTDHIDALYSEDENRALPLGPNTSFTVETMAEAVVNVLSDIMGGGNFDLQSNFFTQGMDSLQVLLLVRRLKAALGVSRLQPSTIYLNPNPLSLATALIEGAHSEKNQTENPQAEKVLTSRSEELNSMLSKLQDRVKQQAEVLAFLGRIPNATAELGRGSQVVILTGSTGFVGSYILRSLLAMPDVIQIYCLNRAADASVKQCKSSTERDATLPQSFSKDRVQFLQADLAQNMFGLTADQFQKLRSTATMIVHNAWQVDFNAPLSAFQGQLIGLTNLCTFAAAADSHPTLLYLSSISAVQRWSKVSSGASPEQLVADLGAPEDAGYAESKYVAERLLGEVSQRFGLDIRIARVGQVCGPVRSHGLWNPREWLPRLVLSARTLQALPATLGHWSPETPDVDWIPVDVLADALVEIGMASNNTGEAQVYHLVNPHPTAWSTFVPTVAAALEAHDMGHSARDANSLTRDQLQQSIQPQSIATVSALDWLARLKASIADLDRAADSPSQLSSKDTPSLTSKLSQNPAWPLLDFYELQFSSTQCVRCETAKAQSVSSSLRACPEIRPRDIQGWVEGWIKAEGHR